MIDDYTHALQIEPTYFWSYYSRGKVRAELKDYQGAIKDYIEALRINPNNDNFCQGVIEDLEKAVNQG